MITFEDVQKKYFQAGECMNFNTLEIANNDGHIVMRLDDKVLDRMTLVRWLYGSSKEFLVDYESTASKLKDKTTEEERLIEIFGVDLTKKLKETEFFIRKKYPYITVQEVAK